MNDHPVNLPTSDSPTLAVVQPTDEEKLLQWTKNGASWKGALSLEAYLRREEHLARQDFTKEGGLTYWVLVDTAPKDRVVLAGCETFRKRAVVAQGGKTRDVITHGVGSVFSPPEYRGRGYAARMMQELGNKLRTWQPEHGECQFSVLWSDIGKKFYAAHGWEPFPSAHISLPASTAAGNDGTLPPVRELYPADLADLCAADEALMRKNMQERAADGKTHVAILPRLDKIQWHHAREEFVGKEFYGRVPEVKGAIVGDEEGRRAWCYWTRMWYNPDAQQDKDNTMHILRLVVEEDVSPDAVVAAIAALLARAQQEAAGWHMAEVETWSPSPEVVAAARSLDPKTEVINRDKDSIASLRWYGDSPSNGGSLTEAVEWVGNEKYGWC
ncbi:uncharacterized protein K452DRAFT_227682 [Aplosporella prunicola CBS 121167]|uniref:LYC1 C-terminal domain-containing protein n=1 Tax=Aplosporella prunicola CBS 121167 TaxID=1176127 RepID=A0A6A6BH83_9PEZI|nr:uncharacterized protein K452DRAFT_227682 [Aplosporella prunicola CBS 121167]KAF2142237.1 hypothetical protein K452DRAFT_227682 [Aplosporella prunicola CBS 121167]